ncbi:hypothetical protein V6Z11_D04G078600 [Gossypium hirsutum]
MNRFKIDRPLARKIFESPTLSTPKNRKEEVLDDLWIRLRQRRRTLRWCKNDAYPVLDGGKWRWVGDRGQGVGADGT